MKTNVNPAEIFDTIGIFEIVRSSAKQVHVQLIRVGTTGVNSRTIGILRINVWINNIPVDVQYLTRLGIA